MNSRVFARRSKTIRSSAIRYVLALSLVLELGVLADAGTAQSSACPVIPADFSAADELAAMELLKSHMDEEDVTGAGFQLRNGAAIPLLHVAAYKGCLDFLKYYITIHGMDHVSLRNLVGMNVLHIAVNGGHIDVVKYLLEQGADPRETISHIVILGANRSLAGARVVKNVDARQLAELKGHEAIVDIIPKKKP